MMYAVKRFHNDATKVHIYRLPQWKFLACVHGKDA